MASQRRPQTRSPSLALLALGVGLTCAGVGEYVKVVNGRCAEFEGVYPLGEEGKDWGEDTDTKARRWCRRRKWCVGFMRYISDDPIHCDAWCGRPQFCNALDLSEDDRWVSYVKEEHLRPSEEADGGARADDEVPLQSVPPRPPPYDVECPWPYASATRLFSELPTREDRDEEAVEAPCRVLHHQKGDPLPALNDPYADFHAVLSEDIAVAPFLTASRAGGPWLFDIDPSRYLPTQAVGPKRFYLSVFFLSEASRCDGREDEQWGPEEAEHALPGHVYVDDGLPETREEAFRPYHFSVICGRREEAGFIPQAILDAVAYAVHPLVLNSVHGDLHRAFFHLPDALQAYTRIHPGVLEMWCEKLYNDPAKNEAMYYKQTFLFLMQDLFLYRYRQPPRERLEISACGICEERRRRLQQGSWPAQDFADATPADSGGEAEGAAVGIAVCVMSRRSGHALRHAIRETWALEVLAQPGSALRFFVGRPGGERDDPREANEHLHDEGFGDIVELDVPESYQAVTLKAFAMLEWAHRAFPNLLFFVRVDDDVYLRPRQLFAHLERRPTVSYLWGNFDHGSNPVRDPLHPHYNSYDQFPDRKHPLFGDIFPPYARGNLWAMSWDLLARIAEAWRGEVRRRGGKVSLALMEELPHPDDPAIGVTLLNLVDEDGISVNIDDRDLNVFALNPSCNATYLGINRRVWAVHHVDEGVMRCMWRVDAAAMSVGVELGDGESDAAKEPLNEPVVEDARLPLLPDLCECQMEVVEEVMEGPDEEPFDYPRDRFCLGT